MSNPWHDVMASLEIGERADRAVKYHADQFARLIAGRLRSVECTDTLRSLKRELRGFNSRSGNWRKRGTTT